MNELIAAAKGAGGTGRDYSSLKRRWTDSIALLARAARIEVPAGPVHLIFTWRERSRRRDPDNIAAGGRKLVLDGLVLAGVLRGDGWAQVAGWTDSFEISDRPGVMVRHEGRSQFPAAKKALRDRFNPRHGAILPG